MTSYVFFQEQGIQGHMKFWEVASIWISESFLYGHNVACSNDQSMMSFHLFKAMGTFKAIFHFIFIKFCNVQTTIQIVIQNSQT